MTSQQVQSNKKINMVHVISQILKRNVLYAADAENLSISYSERKKTFPCVSTCVSSHA
jgi:hypothetical protein